MKSKLETEALSTILSDIEMLQYIGFNTPIGIAVNTSDFDASGSFNYYYNKLDDEYANITGEISLLYKLKIIGDRTDLHLRALNSQKRLEALHRLNDVQDMRELL